MNLQSLRRFTPALAVLVIALVLFALPRLDSLFFAGARYEQCSRLVSTDAAKALAFARVWRASRPDSPMARHCEAIALFATKDYLHSAGAFLALANETDPANTSLSAQLLQQAAKAYEAAGKLNEAGAAAAKAQILAPGNKDINDLVAEITRERANFAPEQPVSGRRR